MSWPRWLPNPWLTIVALTWGINFSIIKLAYRDFSPEAVALLRFVAMLPLLWLIALAARQLKKVEKGDWPRLLWLGFLASGVYMILFLEGMERASPAQGAIAIATAPIFMALFSILRGQDSFRWSLVWGSALAFGGVVLASPWQKTATGSPMGTVLVVIAAVVWAWSAVGMKTIMEKYPALSAITLSLPGAGLALVPYGLGDVTRLDWPAVTGVGWFAMIYFTVIAGALGFTLYYKGLSEVGPARTGLVQYVIPPIAAIGAYFILRDPMIWRQWAGLALALSGVLVGSGQLQALRRGGPGKKSETMDAA